MRIDEAAFRQALDAFEHAWKTGPRPALRRHLPAREPEGSHQLAFELIKMDLEYRIRAGDLAPCAGAYFTLPEAPLRVEEKAELVAAEYQWRWEAGERDLRKAQLAVWFPELTEPLASLCPLWNCPACKKKRIALTDEAAIQAACPRCGAAVAVSRLFPDRVPAVPPAAREPSGQSGRLPEHFGHYRILRLLETAGGEASDAYLAHDTRLQRAVTLRVPALLAPDSAARERFLGEAQRAASPGSSLGPVFEAGESAGIPYYTTPGATSEIPPSDPRFVEEALGLIRTWGWERGLAMMLRNTTGENDAVPPATRLMIGWLAGERGEDDCALEQFKGLDSSSALAGWASLGAAFADLRRKDFPAARAHLERASARAGDSDRFLHGAVGHLRGALALHQGQLDEACAGLILALERIGPEHFTTGRIIDSLGMLYAARNNYWLAREYYTRALERKQRFGDDTGVALSHGQLGRLLLDWGQLEEADRHFREGLEMCQRLGDRRGEAQLYNHRAQVFLHKEKPDEALAMLEESLRIAGGRWSVLEGYARKDLALCFLATGDLEGAGRECTEAERLFREAAFAEGVSHALRVRGLIHGARGKVGQAGQCLLEAAAGFDAGADAAEVAQTLRDLAGVLRSSGTDERVVAATLSQALAYAERSGRHQLWAAIDKHFREAASRRYAQRLKETSTVENGEQNAAVLCVEFQEKRTSADSHPGSDLARGVFAEAERVLEGQQLDRLEPRGFGLLALAFGAEGGERARRAAAALAKALADLNAPRHVLGWRTWDLHHALVEGPVALIGVAAGDRLPHFAGPPIEAACRLVSEMAG